MRILILSSLLLTLPLSSSLLAQACCSPSGASASFGTAEQTNLGGGQLKLALFWEYYDQNRTLAARGEVAPLQPQTRTMISSLLASYGISRRLTVSTVVPMVSRERSFSSGFGGDLAGIGLGDARLAAQWQLWADSPFALKAINILAGVRLPTGATAVSDNGVDLPQSLQPGTGAWGLFVGTALFANFHPLTFFANARLQHNFENEDGYRFGKSWEVSLGSGYAFSRAVEVFVGGRYLDLAVDEQQGLPIVNTGERRLYLFPGVTLQPLSLPLSLQLYTNLPIWEEVKGLGAGLGFNLIMNVSYTLTW